MPLSGNTLLAIRVKKASKLDVKGPILKYIKKVYGEHMANEAADDLDTIQDLRNDIANSTSSSVGIGLEKFAKYFRALKAIETRFPISTDSSQVSITFTWYDSFKEFIKSSQKNIHFEKAAVLFCLAAVSSQRGMDAQRSTKEGKQEAIESFCFAAGLLQYLKDHVSIKTDAPRPVDLSADCCYMLERLMLAQAQECFYELVCANDNMTPITRAKVAKQVAHLYAEVTAQYSRPVLAGHFDKSWAHSSRLKQIMYEAEALLHAGYDHKARREHGAYTARLRCAAQVISDKKKEIRAASAELQSHVKLVEDKVLAKLEEAENENKHVYMELIPDGATLPPVPSQMLVGCKLPGYLTNEAENWFSDIVPDKVAKNLSKYSAKVDEMVRDLLQQLATATDDARLALVQHDLPGALDALNPSKKAELPDRALAALQDDFVQRGGAMTLQQLARNLVDLRSQVQGGIGHCTAILDEEARCDEARRQRWGGRWTRPASNVLAAPLRETISRYDGNLRTASQSDERVLGKLEACEQRLLGLSADHARSKLPSLQAPMVTTGAADPATVVNNLRQALDAMSSLGSERAAVEERVKAARDSDNILPALMNAGPETVDALFERNLQKFEPFAAEVATNVQRQAQLLSVIHQNMSAFKTVYDVEGWRLECEQVADEIIADVATGNEVMSQLNEGIVFYSGLQDSVKKLHQMCSDFAMTRNIELEEREIDLNKRESSDKANEEAARKLMAADLARAESAMASTSLEPPGAASHRGAPPTGSGDAGPPTSSQPQAAYSAYPPPAAPWPPQAYQPPQHGHPPAPYGPPQHPPPYGAYPQPQYHHFNYYAPLQGGPQQPPPYNYAPPPGHPQHPPPPPQHPSQPQPPPPK